MICIRLYNKKIDSDFQEITSAYLFPYIYRFCKKENIAIFNSTTELSFDQVSLLNMYIKMALEDLLNDTYTRPEDKFLQKKFSRYERFVFNNVKYIVDVYFDLNGRLIYSLYNKICILNQCIENREALYLEIETFDILPASST